MKTYEHAYKLSELTAQPKLVATKKSIDKRWTWLLTSNDHSAFEDARLAGWVDVTHVVIKDNGKPAEREFGMMARVVGKPPLAKPVVAPAPAAIAPQPQRAPEPTPAYTVMQPAVSRTLAQEVRGAATELRTILFKELADLRDGKSDPERATAVAKVAGCIIDTVRAQVETERLQRTVLDVESKVVA